MTSHFGDASTVVGDAPYGGPYKRDETSAKDDYPVKPPRSPIRQVNTGTPQARNAFTMMDYTLEDRPFFVKIGKDGVIGALEKLDHQLQDAGRARLLSKKQPTDWAGKEVVPGQLGLINHGGSPKVLTKSGRYPGFPLRNWWAREWCGTKGLSDTVIEFNGLTVVQVSQNQAAVVSDPQNHIFVIKNSGFVAYAVEGTYDVLSIVDQTHLPSVVKDRITGVVLGSTHEVKMTSRIGGAQEKDYIVATFLNIPANNCAILQRGDDLELLGAGQSVITNPSVTLRGLYTLGENQLEMPTKDMLVFVFIPSWLVLMASQLHP
jgi:hypothetical protein